MMGGEQVVIQSKRRGGAVRLKSGLRRARTEASTVPLLGMLLLALGCATRPASKALESGGSEGSSGPMVPPPSKCPGKDLLVASTCDVKDVSDCREKCAAGNLPSCSNLALALQWGKGARELPPNPSDLDYLVYYLDWWEDGF
jgi:hypothetical protein